MKKINLSQKQVKKINYLQIMVTTVIVMTIIGFIIPAVFQSKDINLKWVSALCMMKISFVSVLGFTFLSEVKKPVWIFGARNLSEFFSALFIFFLIVMVLVDRFYWSTDLYNFVPYLIYDNIIFGIIAMCFILGIINFKVGISGALIVAALVPILGVIDANYFLMLGFLLMCAFAGFLVRKIFFTKWVSYLPKEKVEK